MNRLSGRLLLIVAAFALLLVLFPLAATGAGTFTDVPDGHTFKADIDWLASVGVTKGCNPPANDKFCPEDPVTRGQVAAFMHRLANGVVAAKNHNHDADYLAIGGKAVDADKLDGKDSAAFSMTGHEHDADYLAIDGKAADADLLDGKNSSAFISGASWQEADFTFSSWADGTERTATLDCPGLDYPISGGAVEGSNGMAMSESYPYFNSIFDRGWKVSYENMWGGTITATGTIYVMCGDFELIAVPLSAPENPDSESG